ncbi:cyclic GMP-AMP synthase DncV-like nucleotidyltransferase [Peribacillus frigoritolerans]|uniref:cyclic GMP-AMP synthase DncV-like nucleotidyltransferase n=1 Tax=Peribacillus frigoritolerans TaxID=450367 RepID=UPI0025A2020F|nr:nucleotidyltransferase [Peribacillus frigoritolerans]MDM5305809.1 nucleotidyltransferase [Peribacillus frigoritolerans]
MVNIQKQFEEFHDEIKLKRFKENKELREKRDIITNKIKKGVKTKFEDMEKGVPSLEFIDQGSYAVDLGIVPKDKDYDIDEGVIFDLYKEDYTDSLELKKIIRDILENHTNTPPKIKNPCVTITYSLDDEPAYHVDLPVYIKSKDDSNLYIAWGKEFANKENKYWDLADPKGLNDHIKNSFTDDAKKQFKRVVRYMKKWKDVCFNSSGGSRPPSVGITLAAVDLFSYKQSYNSLSGKFEDDDLYSLKDFVSNLKNKFILKWDPELEKSFYTIEYNLPVQPYSNVFSRMSNTQMDYFYQKLNDLENALTKADGKSDPHEACKVLSPKYFGDKFPIPESKEARYKQVALSSAPSSNSAKGY